MAWTEEQDLLLCREILISQPYKFPFGSRERGYCWSEVANRLNECHQPRFAVDQRAVRERYAKIESTSRIEWPGKKEQVESMERKVS